MLHRNWPFSVLGQENASTASMTHTIPKRMRKPVSRKPLHVPLWPPQHFPEKLREVCREFEDVLVEDLESNQTIQCPEMDVTLKEGVKPFFARKPRKAPLHWSQKIKQEVKKLVRAGVIEKIPPNETARWISPAGWVSKDCREEKIRLICDLRMLNKSMPVDGSIFPTPSEIMQNLNADSKFFIKSDMLQGYHQIPLAKEARNLFCFALDSGLYRYLRTPMGYSRSSHYFNKVVQKCLEDIEKVHVEIDDVLVEGVDSDEAAKTFKQILLK